MLAAFGLIAFIFVAILCLIFIFSMEDGQTVANVVRNEPSPRLKFLQGLVDQQEPRSIQTRWSLGYLYTFTLHYSDVKVELEYNTVRKTWDISIWSHEASQFLFYYDCLSVRPWSSINFMVNRYNLRECLEEALAKKEEEDTEKECKSREIINRYTQ